MFDDFYFLFLSDIIKHNTVDLTSCKTKERTWTYRKITFDSESTKTISSSHTQKMKEKSNTP